MAKNKPTNREQLREITAGIEQSIKELIGQNQGVSSIPIEKTDLKGFEQVARKYGVDYAITKDQNLIPPKYTKYFKAKEAEALPTAIEE